MTIFIVYRQDRSRFRNRYLTVLICFPVKEVRLAIDCASFFPLTTGLKGRRSFDSAINTVSFDGGIPPATLLHSNSGSFPHHQNRTITAGGYSDHMEKKTERLVVLKSINRSTSV